MGKKKPKIEIVEYCMSIHYGIAAGPVDEIRAILVNEKEAWKGSLSVYTELNINKPDLFGGPKKEGGVGGKATYLPGGAAQVMPEFLAKRLGLTSATCPGFRGISSIFFTRDRGGFYWSANQPTVPGTWIVARRAAKGLSSSLAMVPDPTGALNETNPSHIMYEVLTNTDWGIGTPTSAINVQSFEDAAQALYDDGFGLSMLWTEQTAAEDFISNILTYIDGVIYVNPRDGLLTLQLIRGGYDDTALFNVNPSNSKMTNYQRKLWGETINEVVVSWTNPESEESETVSVQDLANIAMQGGVVSDSNDYKGIRNSDLAMKVAVRDLRVAASPLASLEAVVNRDAWDIAPGSVVTVTWPKHGMVNVKCRVGNVDYGKIGDSTIKLALMEDVFSLDTQDYITPPKSGWINPNESPAPLLYSLVFTLPYYMLVNQGEDLSGLEAPNVFAGVLGAQPGVDTNEFILASMAVDTLGNPVVELGSDLSTISRGTLSAALPFAVTSTVTLNGITQGDGLVAGYFLVLGTTDRNMEICLITAVADEDTCTISRGMMDTTPKAWPIDAGAFILPPEAIIVDEELHTAGETVDYRALTVTSKGMLDYDAATDIEGPMTMRPWAPLRPANVKINGTAYGTINVAALASVSVTWQNRNRLFEDTILLDWDDATATPESGQTTSIVISNPGTGTVISRIDGLTGVSYTLDTTALGAAVVSVQVISVRDGIDSIQGHSFNLIGALGYGKGYGFSYGKS